MSKYFNNTSRLIWPTINLYISVVLERQIYKVENSFIKEQYKYIQIQATFEHLLQVNSLTAQVQSFPSNLKPREVGR